MRTLVVHFVFFASFILILSPLAVAHASSPPADSVHFCAPFDYEQWRREYPRPAGKRLAALDVGEPRTVRMIYFLPNDRPYRPAVVDKMKTMIRQAQTLLAEQMQAHGFGRKTFRFEADAQGEPLVHRVDGRQTVGHYLEYDTASAILGEIDPLFDIEANVYLIFIEVNPLLILSHGQEFGGIGSRTSKQGGFGLLSSGADGEDLSYLLPIVAHEMGHAFGLQHDFRDEASIMSYGAIPDRLSACSAGFLAVNPYFNPTIPIKEQASPRIDELTSSVVPIKDETSIPIRNKVRDGDGLHQVFLFVKTKAPHRAAGFFETKSCRGLGGETEAVVEFDYDGAIPSWRESEFSFFDTQLLAIQAIDVLGNTAFSREFELVTSTFRAPIATLMGAMKSGYYWISFSPDGTLLASGGDRLRLWDVKSGELVDTFSDYGWVYSVDFSPDGSLLASAGGQEDAIRLWDVKSGELVDTLYGHDGGIYPVDFSPDGTLLASGGKKDFWTNLWDVKSGALAATFYHDAKIKGTVLSVAFSPDGSLLASAGITGEIELWEVSSGEYLASFDGRHEEGIHLLDFSPDGRLLASGDRRDSVIILWNVATRKSIATLEGKGPVSFSPDGRLLATGHVDGNIRIWGVSTHQPVIKLPALRNICTVSFSPDGHLLASGGVGGPINLWDVSEWTQLPSTRTKAPLPHTLTKVSGDGQEGTVVTALAKPFVVSVLDQNGSALAGAVVTFSVTAGGGTLSSTTATTDANGRARSILTLGLDPGTNTVTATVEGLEPITFTVSGQATTDSDGEEEDGEADDELAFGFSREVEDQAYTAGTAISALQLPEAVGGEGEVTYRVSDLPAGLAFDAATRTLSGTPEAATDGAVEVTYTAEDSTGVAATLTFSITVNPPLSFGDLFDLFN